MWTYKQPTQIRFGLGARKTLPELAARFGSRPILITDSALRDTAMVAEALASLGPNARLFSEVEPNPTVTSVDRAAHEITKNRCDVVVAIGGGSSLDCAKAAAAVAAQGGSAREYHTGGKQLSDNRLPMIAMPTTAGTGSEVTPIAVLDDPEIGVKAPLVHDSLFASMALVDPELTVTMPRYVTACTGLDALAHAVEGYWSKNHQPICDLMALEAVRLIVRHLPIVLEDGADLDARTGMSQAALLGGLAFHLPKNAAVHACSYPLCTIYHLPHGAGCALTLDHFMKFNAEVMGERGNRLARAAGVEDMAALSGVVADLKRQAGLPTTLSEIGVTAESLDELVQGSFVPMMKNNPRDVTASDLRSLYEEML
jgi:alcohol dehydrogenase